MKDRYIGIREIPHYGQYFVGIAPTYLSVHPAMMQELIDSEKEVQKRIDDALRSTGDSRTTSLGSLRDQRELLETARSTLLELYETLYPMRSKGIFDLTRFFPTGKKGDIGHYLAELQENLKRVCDAFAMYPSIPNVEALKGQVIDLRAQLETQALRAAGDIGVSLEDSAEWRALREEWNRKYGGAQRVVRGLFERANRKGEWKKLFLDYQAGEGSVELESDVDDGEEGAEGDADGGEGETT